MFKAAWDSFHLELYARIDIFAKIFYFLEEARFNAYI